MNNRINFLPPWVETNLQPAFYDKQSGTCIQQTARMYAKVNQLVRIANEQWETIQNYINQFIELKDFVEDYFENLDVQEEINNKLDEMAEDGTLTAILNNAVLPTIEAFESQVNEDIADLRGELSSIASASPIPVSSTSQMTDQSRIYVNTTDGKWYYWSTSDNAWTIGGTYQATAIADNSVAGNNLYDGTATPKYKYIENYYLDATGTPTYSTNWEYCSEYIPCTTGQTITVTNVRQSAIHLYDANKDHITYINVGNDITDYTRTIATADIAYIRLAFPKNYTHTCTVNGKEVLNKWNYEWLNVTSENLDFTPDGLDGNSIKDNSIYRDKIILSNGLSVTENSYWSNSLPDPYYTSNSSWLRLTDLIDVEAGDVIRGENIRGTWCIFFDESSLPTGNGGNVSTISNAQVTVPSGSYKIGLNIAKNALEAGAKFYINEKPVIYDNGSRATIDWLKLNDEQKADLGGYDISRFKNYKTLFIGDSITEKNYRAQTNWVDYITSELNIDVFTNAGMSGTGIIKPSGGNPNWLTALPTYSDDYDMILIMGDMNDWSNEDFNASNIGQFGDSTTDTFYGTMKVYLEMILNKYPLAKIGWITSTPRNQQIEGTSDYLHGQSSIFEQANNIIKEMCNNYSIPCLELYNESSLYPWIDANKQEYFKADTGEYVADAIHPNSKGQRIMAYKIKDFIVRNF